MMSTHAIGELKNPKWPTQKTIFFKIANSQNFFVKISWIGPWVSLVGLIDAKGIDEFNLYDCEAV